MTHPELPPFDSAIGSSELTTLLQTIPPGRRGAVLQSALSFRPGPTLDQSFAVGPIRAAFADYWEVRFGHAVPVERFPGILDPPVPIGSVLEFNKLTLMRGYRLIEPRTAASPASSAHSSNPSALARTWNFTGARNCPTRLGRSTGIKSKNAFSESGTQLRIRA